MKFRSIIRILLLSFAVCGCFNSFSQKAKPSAASENVKKRIYSDDSLSELMDQAGELKDNSPNEALEKVKDALALSILKKDAFNEGKCYLLMGEINMNIEEWKLALENFATAYDKLFDSFHKTPEFRDATLGLGLSNLRLANYEESLKYFKECLSLTTTNREKAERQLDISEVFYQMGNYQSALKEVEDINYLRKVADPALEVKIENQKAKIYAQTNQAQRASQSFQSSQRILRDNSAGIPKKDEQEMQSAKEDISDALSKQELYDEEISLRNSSIEYNLESKNLGEVSKDKVELSKALVAKGETNAAIRELEEAAYIADTIGDPKKQATAFLSLAEVHENYGNNSQALSAYKKYSDAVYRAEQARETKLVEKSELIKQQRDIEEIAKYVSLAQKEDTIAQAMVTRQRIIIYGLIFLILTIAVASYFIYKNAQASKKANQLLALKSLRSQMNPHFIFNALNSLNQFVAQNDERTANKFLSEFSRLMRLVLENSQEDFIPLHKEEEIISLYLKLEHYRFRDKFDYKIFIDDDINRETIHIPPMLIQPYIENAVWHGLRYKESKGELSLHISQRKDDLIVEIQDNGIGRQKSAELKTNNQKKHQSTGLKNIRERIEIINKIYHAEYKVFIEDLPGGAGTKVELHLPVNHKFNDHA